MSIPDRAALCYGDSKGDQVVNLNDLKFHRNLGGRTAKEFCPTVIEPVEVWFLLENTPKSMLCLYYNFRLYSFE